MALGSLAKAGLARAALPHTRAAQVYRALHRSLLPQLNYDLRTEIDRFEMLDEELRQLNERDREKFGEAWFWQVEANRMAARVSFYKGIVDDVFPPVSGQRSPSQSSL